MWYAVLASLDETPARETGSMMDIDESALEM